MKPGPGPSRACSAYSWTAPRSLVIRGGENVYCVEVEAALHGRPDVEDAAVLGVPHPVLGEEVAAVVRVGHGAAVTADALRDHVGRSPAAFKVGP